MKTSACAAHFLAAVIMLAPQWATAHCDSLDGPVVGDARIALEQRDPAPILKWVKQAYEGEVRDAFRKALDVRGKGGEAQALADRYFFETLVRLHRAGEGEAFTGLKPAGSVEPGIASADAALQSGIVDQLAEQLSGGIGQGIKRRFAAAAERKQQASQSVEAGRAYVEAYVDYIHFVEAVHRLSQEGAPHQHHESVGGAE